MTDTQAQRPLDGIRVIGIEQYIAGPYCTMLLADAGAEVIKIERLGSGDPRRSIGPYVEKNGVRKAGGFLSYNRNKQSLAVDLRSAAGRDIVCRLAVVSDVVVDNLRPGVTTKLELDYESLSRINSRLVYAAISGFGRLEGYRSAYSDRPAFDIVAEAMSGVMNLIGFADKPPKDTLYGLADVYSGVVTANGILQALFMRERTGEGQMVDSAMVDNMMALNERAITLYSTTGSEPQRGKLEHQWPRGAFPCKDGYVALNVPDDNIWGRLAQAVGRPDLVDDPRSIDGVARARNAEFLQPALDSWMATRTRVEVVDTLNAAGVPTGSVYSTADVFADEHFRRRGMLVEVADPDLDPSVFARTTPLLSGSPEIPTAPAPNLGQHTRSILEDLLEYDSADVDRLVEEGVVEIAE